MPDLPSPSSASPRPDPPCPHCLGTGKEDIPLAGGQGVLKARCLFCHGTGKKLPPEPPGAPSQPSTSAPPSASPAESEGCVQGCLFPLIQVIAALIGMWLLLKFMSFLGGSGASPRGLPEEPHRRPGVMRRGR